MCKRYLVAAGLCFLLTSIAPTAGAADIISATGTAMPASGGGTVTTSDWTVVFNDTSNDGLLQVDEIVSFSGATVSLTGFTSIPDIVFNYDAIVGSPTIGGMSVFSG